MDNRTIEEIRENENKLIKQIIDMENLLNKINSSLVKERAKRMKVLTYIDMDKHISTNWDILSNKEKDEFVLSLLNEIEKILKD